MTRRRRIAACWIGPLLGAVLVLFGMLGCPSARAQQSGLRDYAIGYIGWNADPRYAPARLEQRFQGEPWGRPVAGARVALGESKFQGMAAGLDFKLDERLVGDTQAVFTAVTRMRAAGTRFILLDLPAGTVARVAAHFAGRGVLFFNVSARDDRLRGTHCQADLLNTIPSDAMRNDALAQYLTSRQWTDVLLLVGPERADGVLARSFERSARRFGLDIVDTKHFILGNNPRQREQNNVKLLTSGLDYDAVYIADSEGEFSRDSNYALQKPRPVIGSAGLVPEAWHWSWRSYGARQLNHRLIEQAGRPMTSVDWAAWAAVKAVVASIQRVGGGDYDEVRAYLTSDKLDLDSFKGYRVAFRPWDGQLRQPILLTTGNWVVARAPLPGFEHPTNYLDTLGFDSRESACER